jgi:hypothetical protein
MTGNDLGACIHIRKGLQGVQVGGTEWSHDLTKGVLQHVEVAQEAVAIEVAAFDNRLNVPVMAVDRLSLPLDQKGVSSGECRRYRQFKHHPSISHEIRGCFNDVPGALT